MNIKIINFLKYDHRTRLTLFSIAVFWVIFLLVFFSQYFRPYLLKVSFYNVGQGDGIFIETPERYQVLVDGGPGAKILEEIARDMPFYDRTIDLLIPTHPDSDHIAGLVDILERYKVKTILLPKIKSNTIVYKRLLNDIQKEGAILKEAVRTESVQKIELPGEVSFEILNPIKDEPYKSDNDSSMVTLFRYGNIEFLLLADVTSKKEKETLPLLPKGIEVVKIAHHGSKYSSDPEFLRSISPKLCVIEVGENKYGHPSKEALSAMQSSGCKIWRTDRDGTLTVYSDGERYWIQ
ncbi:MAG: MBL fold metallo-hydrolase [Candidatus Portnoybacteria bacterium]|nr:MBL fold metallo-hydrolase [Candidatus Portnoybacteria bacterium]